MALTNVVARFEPFHWTVVLETKPDPVIVSVKAGPPAMADVGEREFAWGAGLLPPFEPEQPDARVAAIPASNRRTLFVFIAVPRGT